MSARELLGAHRYCVGRLRDSISHPLDGKGRSKLHGNLLSRILKHRKGNNYPIAPMITR